ncbi:hypothetical protein D3C78_1399160 [compost metagenome]
MTEAVTDGMVATLAELQAQITALVQVAQGVQRHQSLNLAIESPKNALRLQTGLQLQAQLLAQLRKTDRSFQEGRLLTKAQALQFGAIEVNCVGLGRWFH